MDSDIQALNEQIKIESQFIDNVLTEVGRVIVGQQQIVQRI